MDDSLEFLDLVRCVLEPQGYEVTCIAANANVRGLIDSRPDLLIIDLRLAQPTTDLSGWDLVVLASHHAQLHDIPILLCSADARELEQRRRVIQGADRLHVLAKPFQLGQLETLVDRLVGDGQGLHPTPAAG